MGFCSDCWPVPGDARGTAADLVADEQHGTAGYGRAFRWLRHEVGLVVVGGCWPDRRGDGHCLVRPGRAGQVDVHGRGRPAAGTRASHLLGPLDPAAAPAVAGQRRDRARRRGLRAAVDERWRAGRVLRPPAAPRRRGAGRDAASAYHRERQPFVDARFLPLAAGRCFCRHPGGSRANGSGDPAQDVRRRGGYPPVGPAGRRTGPSHLRYRQHERDAGGACRAGGVLPDVRSGTCHVARAWPGCPGPNVGL